MLSRVAAVVVVRHASQSTFKLPPIKFRHSQLGSSRDEGVQVITSPISHQKREKVPDHYKKREKGEERAQKKQKSFRQPQEKQERVLVSEENFNSCENNVESPVKPKKTNTVTRYTTKKRTKFTSKSSTQSLVDPFVNLGIHVKGEIIFGIFPVLLAIQAKRRTVHQLIYKSGSGNTSSKIRNILTIAKEQGVPITSLEPSQFKQIFQGDQVHQGVCCDASHLTFLTLDEDHPEQEEEYGQGKQEGECEEESRVQRERQQESQHARVKHKNWEDDRYIHPAFEKKNQQNYQTGIERRQKLWLYLDQIQDPMNFGAVLRSAYFMGVDRVLTSEAFSTKITSIVSKASAGVAEVFPVHQVKDPLRLAASLTQAGWELVSSASPSCDDGGDGGRDVASLTDVTAFHPKGNVLLIIGNEGKGISPELQQRCHTVLTINPGRSLHPHLQCLNVSVATALLLHSLCQKLSLRGL